MNSEASKLWTPLEKRRSNRAKWNIMSSCLSLCLRTSLLTFNHGLSDLALQFVVNTGNIQIMTVASLDDRILRTMVDLERATT